MIHPIPECYPPIPGLIVAMCVLFLFTGRKHSRMLGSKFPGSGLGEIRNCKQDNAFIKGLHIFQIPGLVFVIPGFVIWFVR